MTKTQSLQMPSRKTCPKACPKAWKVSVLTLFPDVFPGVLGASVIGKAREQEIWSMDVVNIRDFASDKHQTVDDTACGGGPGMVMRADVVDAAFNHVTEGASQPRFIYMSPRGKPLTQAKVSELTSLPHMGILCGRFEGVDQRVLDAWDVEEISIGDYVLAGGEVAAQVLIEACVRTLPGVLGDVTSLEEESFSSGLLEYPQYTRPRVWQGREVPDILFSGHHQQVKSWRQEKSEELTKDRRPDLWKMYVEMCKLKEERKG